MNDIVSETVSRFRAPIPAPASCPACPDDLPSVFSESTAFLAADADFFAPTVGRSSHTALAAFIDEECDGAITGLHFLDGVPDSLSEFRSATPESGDELFFMCDAPIPAGSRTVRERVDSSSEIVVELARRGVHAVRFPASDQDRATFEARLVDAFRSEDARGFTEWVRSETDDTAGYTRYNVLPESVSSFAGSALIDTALPATQRARTFLSAYAVLMALPGVVGVRLAAFISDGNPDGRDGPVPFDRFVDSLHDGDTLAGAVFSSVIERLRVRGREPAFRPGSRSRFLDGSRGVVSLVRGSVDPPSSTVPIICLHNIAHTPSDPAFTAEELSVDDATLFRDLISGDVVYPYRTADGRFVFGMEPYESMWLRTFVP